MLSTLPRTSGVSEVFSKGERSLGAHQVDQAPGATLLRCHACYPVTVLGLGAYPWLAAGKSAQGIRDAWGKASVGTDYVGIEPHRSRCSGEQQECAVPQSIMIEVRRMRSTPTIKPPGATNPLRCRLR